MRTESYLILHGLENHRLPGHWQFWIAGRMRDRGHQVLHPGPPDPDAPSYLEWASALVGSDDDTYNPAGAARRHAGPLGSDLRAGGIG